MERLRRETKTEQVRSSAKSGPETWDLTIIRLNLTTGQNVNTQTYADINLLKIKGWVDELTSNWVTQLCSGSLSCQQNLKPIPKTESLYVRVFARVSLSLCAWLSVCLVVCVCVYICPCACLSVCMSAAVKDDACNGSGSCRDEREATEERKLNGIGNYCSYGLHIQNKNPVTTGGCVISATISWSNETISSRCAFSTLQLAPQWRLSIAPGTLSTANRTVYVSMLRCHGPNKQPAERWSALSNSWRNS